MAKLVLPEVDALFWQFGQHMDEVCGVLVRASEILRRRGLDGVEEVSQMLDDYQAERERRMRADR